MYQILKKSREKAKYFVLFTFVITFFLLLAVVFKNDQKIMITKTNIKEPTIIDIRRRNGDISPSKPNLDFAAALPRA